MSQETQLLKGILEGCVLALLSREESYGYRVVERLGEVGFSDVQESTVYPILNRLEKKGQLSSRRFPSELGPPRKVYQLTTSGRAELSDFMRIWRSLRDSVDSLAGEGLE